MPEPILIRLRENEATALKAATAGSTVAIPADHAPLIKDEFVRSYVGRGHLLAGSNLNTLH